MTGFHGNDETNLTKPTKNIHSNGNKKGGKDVRRT
jgi:hypothetical protein